MEFTFHLGWPLSAHNLFEMSSRMLLQRCSQAVVQASTSHEYKRPFIPVSVVSSLRTQPGLRFPLKPAILKRCSGAEILTLGLGAQSHPKIQPASKDESVSVTRAPRRRVRFVAACPAWVGRGFELSDVVA